MKKIVFIGPESTGKTTMSRLIAEKLNEPWVPEFAREYLEKTNGTYQKGDLLQIAKGQLESEEEKTNVASKYLFCDTDLIVIKVWSEHIYKGCDEWILNQIDSRNYDHYFLCKNDFPWKADSLRENPSDGDYFFELYYKTLIKLNKSFQILEGSIDNRLKTIEKTLVELN